MAVLISLLLLFSAFLPLCLSDCGPYGHDISNLVKPGYWWFELDDLKQCGPFSSLPKVTANTTKTCNFFFSVCNPVPVICHGDTVACSFIGNVKTADPVINSWPTNYGSQSTYSFDVTGDSGFSASYTDGQTCYKDTKWKTVINFKCNESLYWNTTNPEHLAFNGAASPKPSKFEITGCSLLITLSGHFACGPVPQGSESASLSVGSLLLILFFPSFFLYCVVGTLVNTHAGRKGKEVIPHSKFWFDLPDLIMDGFLFMMNFLTCREACKRDPNRLYESI